MIRKLTLAAAAATLCGAAFAQSAIHYSEGERIDPSQVARILSASPAPMQQPMQLRSIRMRSIKLLDQPGSAQPSPQAAAQIAAPAQPSAMSLPVRFAFDSAEIEPAALPQLNALAEGIKLLPPGQMVAIEGHTDAIGSPDYNRRLSMRRAIAVKQYLVQMQGIESRRLKAVGLGEADPIDGDPFAARNRRVQFHGG